jgi:hypothetical protein
MPSVTWGRPEFATVAFGLRGPWRATPAHPAPVHCPVAGQRLHKQNGQIALGLGDAGQQVCPAASRPLICIRLLQLVIMQAVGLPLEIACRWASGDVGAPAEVLRSRIAVEPRTSVAEHCNSAGSSRAEISISRVTASRASVWACRRRCKRSVSAASTSCSNRCRHAPAARCPESAQTPPPPLHRAASAMGRATVFAAAAATHAAGWPSATSTSGVNRTAPRASPCHHDHHVEPGFTGRNDPSPAPAGAPTGWH